MTKLEVLLLYISEHNDFYKNIIKEHGITDPTDITQYPILTRHQLQNNRYNMFSQGFKSKYFNQLLRRQASSGSSGIPVNVYWDYKDWYASNMSLWRKRCAWYGIKPSDRYVVFTLDSFGVPPENMELRYINEPMNSLSFNVSLIREDSAYDKMVQVINDFNPKWMYIQPYVLNKIIQAYNRIGIERPVNLMYIESVGEILPSDLRRRAKDFFRVPIISMYGSEEMNGIAFESPEGLMEVLDDNVLLEVKDDSGIHKIGRGEAIITNLNNYAMPLIRYCQNDNIVVTARGRGKIIDIINGRSADSVEINGVELSTMFLCEMIADVNNQYKDIISEYAFQYDKINNKVRVLIKIKNVKMTDAVKSTLLAKLFGFFRSYNNEMFSIEICDYVPHIKNHMLYRGGVNE